jgi:hypothetical protein
MEGKVEHLHVTKSNHADGLPDAQTDTGSHTTVEATDAVVVVDVLESLADGQVLGAVRVRGLALHLDTDNLNRLVPGGQTTTETRSQDLFPGRQLDAVLLASNLADSRLSETGQTEARTPVGSLANGDGVDTAVDTADALLAVDIHKGLESAGRLNTGGGHLVLGDLDGLHAGTETHSSVGLSDTASHTTADTGHEVIGAEGASVVFGLGGDEEENRTLGGCLNPGPRNESLVI